ncbi:hypothetical protein CIK76_15885 [Glutamicibacter sp. BW80]|uniref:AraC family transcriptional regulator n=1 Tax=unclassified Glutamicibacter TaxID=2627139 RepID=UPI000BB97819|nr:AraC family transcriptional regulator [Glutamicibacter sp. BW80]PCC27669.1 hypothetical protein CIK76_15885 [Glutamicibacter sp. BW80]
MSISHFPEHFAWIPTGEQLHFSRPREAEEYFSRLFVSHELQPLEQRTALRLDARARWFHDCGLLTLEYAVPVRISPEQLGDIFLIQLPISGESRMRVGTEEIIATPNRATLPPTDEPAVIRWNRESPHLLICLPRATVEDVAARMYSIPSAAGLTVAHSLDLTTTNGQKFMQTLRAFHDELEADPADCYEVVTAAALEMMIMRFLVAVDHSLARNREASNHDIPDDLLSQNAIAHHFIQLLREHAREDAQISDYAERLGISTRTLQLATAAAFQRSPLKLLVMERLRAAHGMLVDQAAPHLSIAQIATDCGFGHLSRFSASYRQRYGETPRETRKRHLTGHSAEYRQT